MCLRRIGLLGVFALVTLALAAPAQARTIRLGWTERTPAPYYGYVAMTFKVRSVTVTQAGWSVNAEFINRSRGRIGFRRGDSFDLPRLGFGLRVPVKRRIVGQPHFTAKKAISFSPRLPRALEPGTRWSGRFSGRGSLPRRTPISVTFGVFVVDGRDFFSWTTQREFRL